MQLKNRLQEHSKPMDLNDAPLSVKVQMAKKELNSFAMEQQQRYQFPTYMEELIFTSVLSDMREIELKILLDDVISYSVPKEEKVGD